MRGVVFVFVAVIAAAGAIVAYDSFRPSAQRAGSQGATSTSQSGDPLAELSGRLLLPPFMKSQDNATYELRLYPAQLPPDPRIDLPQPAGSRLIGTALRLRNGAPASLDAVLDVPASTTDVAGLFERELTKLGWSPAPNRGQPQGGGGFVPSGMAANRMYCKGEQPPWYSISVFELPSAPFDVRAHIDFVNPSLGFGGTYAGPCAVQQQPVPMSGMNKLPTLRAPDGVVLRGGMGGGGGMDRQTSDASAISKLSVAEIESAFAQQLVAAGWTRVAASASGPVAWSTWKLPGDGDWRGLLLINETGADRRSLTVRAEMTQ
jgi:hypothetical protein